MEHIAIDLGSRESQVCVRNEQGAILLERKVATARLPVLRENRIIASNRVDRALKRCAVLRSVHGRHDDMANLDLSVAMPEPRSGAPARRLDPHAAQR